MLVRRLRTVPCATCDRMPTDIFSDGSPRYDHVHDLPAGATTETQTSGAVAGAARMCPACGHQHPVGTTCLECPSCLYKRT